MRGEDVHLTLDEGPERSFDGATLQLSSDGTPSRRAVKTLKMTEVRPDETPLLNDNYETSSQQKRARPNSLALVPWSGENAKDYFCFRDGLITAAIEECRKEFLESEEDVIGNWLLTEISLWDSEKERLIILTDKNLYIIKYDFIALKQLDQRKVSLNDIDTLVIGELTYPSTSIIPHLDGLATGVSTLVRSCLVRPIQERLAGMPSCTSTSSYRQGFEPRTRNLTGVRLMWGQGQVLPFMKKWNPFEKDIPFTTLASHPLMWHKDEDNKDRKIFNLDDFILELKRVLDERINNLRISVQHRPVLLENYIGVGALIHNKHALGFFKVRGKFSF